MKVLTQKKGNSDYTSDSTYAEIMTDGINQKIENQSERKN